MCSVLCLVVQLCPTFCDPMDCSLPGSSVHGILQARILEWIATPSSRGSSQHRGGTQVSLIAGGFFTIWATREAHPGIYLAHIKAGGGGGDGADEEDWEKEAWLIGGKPGVHGLREASRGECFKKNGEWSTVSKCSLNKKNENCVRFRWKKLLIVQVDLVESIECESNWIELSER